MSLSIDIPEKNCLKPQIKVIGVGGAGGNAVNNMMTSGLEGVVFTVANTDAQALSHALCENKIQLGEDIAKGLGAGSSPEIGKAAAEESMNEIIEHIKDSNMIFIAAGMGGGTGTGAAPVISRIAREHNILTIGVVTKPFSFEGKHRNTVAEAGIIELQKYVDTLIVIPNQNLFYRANDKTTFADAFKMVDQVLLSGVKSITDLMTMPGLINLDFADIKTVMSEMGRAMMGNGEAEGEDRAIKAAEEAISNPLLDNTSMRGARGVIINITGGADLTLFEADEAANRIKDEIDDSEARIIFGSTFDENMSGKIRVSVVATGMQSNLESEKGAGIGFMSSNINGGNSARKEPVVKDVLGGSNDNDISNSFSFSSSPPPFVPPAAVVPESNMDNSYDNGFSNSGNGRRDSVQQVQQGRMYFSDYEDEDEGNIAGGRNKRVSNSEVNNSMIDQGNKAAIARNEVVNDNHMQNFAYENSTNYEPDHVDEVSYAKGSNSAGRVRYNIVDNDRVHYNNQPVCNVDDMVNKKPIVKGKKAGKESRIGSLFSFFKDSRNKEANGDQELDDEQDLYDLQQNFNFQNKHDQANVKFKDSNMQPINNQVMGRDDMENFEIQDDMFSTPTFLRNNKNAKGTE